MELRQRLTDKKFFRDTASSPSTLVAELNFRSQLRYLFDRNFGFVSRELRDWWIHGIEIATLLTLHVPTLAWFSLFFSLTGTFLRGFHNASFFLSRNLGWDPKKFEPWVSLVHLALITVPLLAVWLHSSELQINGLTALFLLIRGGAMVYENYVYLGTLPDSSLQRMFVPARLSLWQAGAAFVVGALVAITPVEIGLRAALLVLVLSLIRIVPSIYMVRNPIPQWSKLVSEPKIFQWGRESEQQIFYFMATSVFVASLVMHTTGDAFGPHALRAYAVAAIALRWLPRFYISKAYEITSLSRQGRASIVEATLRFSDRFVLVLAAALTALAYQKHIAGSDLLAFLALTFSWIVCLRLLVLFNVPRGRVIEGIVFIFAALVNFASLTGLWSVASQFGLAAVLLWNLWQFLQRPRAVYTGEADEFYATSLLRSFESSMNSSRSWLCLQLRIEDSVARTEIGELAHKLAIKVGRSAKSEEYGRKIWLALPWESSSSKLTAPQIEKEIFFGFPVEIAEIDNRMVCTQGELESFFGWNSNTWKIEKFRQEIPNSLLSKVELFEYREQKFYSGSQDRDLRALVDDFYLSLGVGRGRGNSLRRNRRWIAGERFLTVVPVGSGVGERAICGGANG